MGIEPTSAAWEAAILPLNHARFGFYATRACPITASPQFPQRCSDLLFRRARLQLTLLVK